MKNLFLATLMLVLFADFTFGQLKVESNGRTLFGQELRVYNENNWGYINMGNSINKGLRLTNTGKLYLFAESPTTFITATRFTTDMNLIVMDPSGYYKFWVLGDGSVYSKNSYITSDSTKKEDVKQITGALEKLTQIKGVTYVLDDEGKGSTEGLAEKLENQPKSAKSIIEKKRDAGVFAQDVEKVLPEAVRTLKDGSKVVSYNNLVALLVEAIKEQQLQIEELKVSNSTQKLKSAGDIDEDLFEGELKESLLLQNNPNPFNEDTEISFYLPESVATAQLLIYNMQGKQIKNINVNQRNHGAEIISGSGLQPGMYLYSLIADGKEVDTKRMILTK